MTGTSRNDMRTDWQAEARGGTRVSDRPTGWVAWLLFAGMMLAVVGLLQVLEGLTALLDDSFYAVRAEGLVVNVDYDIWGWTHLVLGAVALVTAFALLRGNIVGRVLGIVVAGVSVIVNLVFLPAYPWWSVLAIAFNVIVIFAITTHGRELASYR